MFSIRRYFIFYAPYVHLKIKTEFRQLPVGHPVYQDIIYKLNSRSNSFVTFFDNFVTINCTLSLIISFLQ